MYLDITLTVAVIYLLLHQHKLAVSINSLGDKHNGFVKETLEVFKAFNHNWQALANMMEVPTREVDIEEEDDE